MSVLNHLRDLFTHMYWANAKVWEIILKTPDAQKHEKLKSIIYHYHVTQYAFYHIWMGLPMEFPKMEDFKTMSDMADWAAKYQELVIPFMNGLKEEDLNSIVKIPWSERLAKVLGKDPEPSTLAETLFHVPAHSAYHRGQVNALIRTAGGEPPLVDFIVWVWLGKPKVK